MFKTSTLKIQNLVIYTIMKSPAGLKDQLISYILLAQKV